jgi:hypothetical protein
MSKKNKIKRPASFSAPQPARSSEFNPDYSHVKRDVRRIGILAGSAFTFLIVLSFFLK